MSKVTKTIPSIYPLQDWVLVTIEKHPEKTKSGIVLTDSSQKKLLYLRAIVMRVGPLVNKNRNDISLDVEDESRLSKGDRVILFYGASQHAQPVSVVEDDSIWLVPADAVIARDTESRDVDTQDCVEEVCHTKQL